MEVSSSAGLNHINNYMRPQAILVDASGEEEEFFLRAFRERANALGTALIELPKNAEQSLMWLTRLDYGSLMGKHNDFQPFKLIDSFLRLLGSSIRGNL